jgi:hypothetical protein
MGAFLGGLAMRSLLVTLVASLGIGLTFAGCGGGSGGGGGGAHVAECSPANACSCGPGVDRPTACTCGGGSTCEIDGDAIEFQCQGNAACGMNCGTDCLITCPGTTSCTVDVGDRGEISCPGTATCEIRCRANCTVEMTGTARSTVYCDGAADGATCEINGCNATDCGDGIYACRMACPEE